MAYKIIPDLCNACGACESECPNRAISHNSNSTNCFDVEKPDAGEHHHRHKTRFDSTHPGLCRGRCWCNRSCRG